MSGNPSEPRASNMHVDGACHCGKITFTAEVEPDSLSICHCTDCQAMSGTAFRANIACTVASFRLIQGEPKRYIKTAESGAKRLMAFCGSCGSQIYSAAAQNPTTYGLRSGTLKQRDALTPARQIWLRSAVPWARDAIDAPAFETEPPKA